MRAHLMPAPQHPHPSASREGRVREFAGVHTYSITCVAFLDALTCPNVEVFRDMPHAQTGETPCIQRHHFGAVIAPRLADEQVRQRLKCRQIETRYI